MLNKTWFGLPLWSVLAPLVACATLVLAWGPAPSALLIALVAAVLIAAVLVAVHHAEVIAHRIGEPLGTLVLAVAVTVIEVALIVSMMLSGGEGAGALARDTVFAAVMIVCNGVIGLCLVAGGMRHRVLTFRIDGTGPALSVLAALSTLTLIVPDYTLTTPGPLLSTAQLLFVGVVSLALYAVFVFVQTVRHRDYFLPIEPDAEHDHAPPPSTRMCDALVKPKK